MNKKLIVTLIAGLLLLTAVSCGNDDETESGTGTGTTADGSYIIVDGTDTNGNPVTGTLSDETKFDPSEQNPTFKDVDMEVYVFTWNANLRSSTVVSPDTVAGGAKEGDRLAVVGESDNWYKLEGGLYIAKTAAAPASALEGFEKVNDTVTVIGTVNFRSYPSADTDSVRGSLTKDKVVTRVAKGEEWSLVKCTVKDTEGKEVEKEYYVHNKYIQSNTEETTTAAAE